jgi:hypothetical protein
MEGVEEGRRLIERLGFNFVVFQGRFDENRQADA